MKSDPEMSDNPPPPPKKGRALQIYLFSKTPSEVQNVERPHIQPTGVPGSPAALGVSGQSHNLSSFWVSWPSHGGTTNLAVPPPSDQRREPGRTSHPFPAAWIDSKFARAAFVARHCRLSVQFCLLLSFVGRTRRERRSRAARRRHHTPHGCHDGESPQGQQEVASYLTRKSPPMLT